MCSSESAASSSHWFTKQLLSAKFPIMTENRWTDVYLSLQSNADMEHVCVILPFPRTNMWIYDSCSATDDIHKAPWKSRNTQTYIHTQTFMRISAKDIHSQHKCHAGIDGLFYINSPQPFFPHFFPSSHSIFSLIFFLSFPSSPQPPEGSS